MDAVTNIMNQCQIDESDPIKLAVSIKNEANKFFNGQFFLVQSLIINIAFLEALYDLAIDLYSKCIELNPNEPIYFSNRSMAYFKKELFGLSLDDADSSLKINPAFVKAYFRRASSNLVCFFNVNTHTKPFSWMHEIF